jgi:hypothetical protein
VYARFAALIERREAAARNLLQSDRRRDKAPSRPGDYLVSAARAGVVAEVEQVAFVPLPDGRGKLKLNRAAGWFRRGRCP